MTVIFLLMLLTALGLALWILPPEGGGIAPAQGDGHDVDAVDDDLDGAVDVTPAPRRGAVPAIQRDPFSLPFVQRRLVVLAAELDGLDRDRTAFARAFHTQAALVAYRALLADAASLAAATPTATTASAASPGRREELLM